MPSSPTAKTLQSPAGKSVIAELEQVAGGEPAVPAFRKRFAKSADVPLAALPSNPDLFESLLAVFRAHKELRNCLIHESRVANAPYAKAWTVASAQSAAHIGMAELPGLLPQSSGDPAQVSLRRVLGLAGLVEPAARLVDAYV